jgi:predicted transcriptional regulator
MINPWLPVIAAEAVEQAVNRYLLGQRGIRRGVWHQLRGWLVSDKAVISRFLN